MKRRIQTIVGLGVLAILAAGVHMSAQTQQAPTFEGMTVRTWKTLHDKILVMAKDTQFPDDKLGFKPHPDSRTLMEEFRHVTIGLEMSTANLKGEQFDYAAREKEDIGKPNTRANMVAEMEAALKASYAAVDAGPKPLLVFWIDHQAEHYGKLVSDYRMVGIVPPISRK